VKSNTNKSTHPIFKECLRIVGNGKHYGGLMMSWGGGGGGVLSLRIGKISFTKYKDYLAIKYLNNIASTFSFLFTSLTSLIIGTRNFLCILTS
jgi:hypothetical protein